MLAIVGLFVSDTALATTYEAQCLNQKGKFSDCKVAIDTENLKIAYKNKKEKEWNLTVPVNKITAINSGEFSKRRVAAAVLVSPLFLFTKKKREQFGVEYLGEDNKSQVTVFQVKKDFAVPIKSELQAFSGKVMRQEEPGKDNLID